MGMNYIDKMALLEFGMWSSVIGFALILVFT